VKMKAKFETTFSRILVSSAVNTGGFNLHRLTLQARLGKVVPEDAGAALVALHLQDNFMPRLVQPFTRATAKALAGLHTVP